MEDNVADALKLAAAVLLFVIALATSMSSFSQARQTSQIILEYSDREYDYTYVEESGTTERIVGAESIIPVIYRSFKENYKIYFYEDRAKTVPMTLYTKVRNDVTQSPNINFIDLKRDDIIVFGNDKEREDFIMALLFGTKINGNYDKTFNDISTNLLSKYKITLNSTGIYDTIKGNSFIESIGEYYQEDETVNPGQPAGSTETPDTNKTKKRVYTYVKV